MGSWPRGWAERLSLGVLLALCALLAQGTGAAMATSGGASYTYDALGRLIGVTYDNGSSIAYSYDAAGNRTQATTALSGATLPAQPGAPPTAGGAPTAPTPPSPPTPPAAAISITGTNANVNLWNALVSDGFAIAGVKGNWTVTVVSGAQVGSTVAGQPAFDTGTFPTGSVLTIVNNGTIEGAGGGGGAGAAISSSASSCDPSQGTNGQPGAAGSPAMQVRLPVTIANNGNIWGGGGGGGGGGGTLVSLLGGSLFIGEGGGGGGGGAGLVPGAGGSGGDGAGVGSNGTSTAGGAPGVFTGNSGTAQQGGAGGGPGQAGANGTLNPASPSGGGCATNFAAGAGGAAGAAIIGSSNVTFNPQGNVLGPLQ